MDNIWILGQKDGGGISSGPATSGEQTSTGSIDNTRNNTGDPNNTGGTGGNPGFPIQYVFLGLMFVMMYFILFRGPRKKQQQHKQMVQTLAKNDKVRTIGGIIGTVVDVKGDEVVLKIDESNNTKIRLSASAIGKNMSKDNG